MKKRFNSVMMACIMSMALLSGCGKAAQEEKMQDSSQAGTEDVSASEENGQGEQAENADRPGQENDAVQSDQAEQSTGIVFEAQDLDGNVVTESIFTESRLTMVNVWATYCNPCLREMPGLGELAGEYDSDQFQIIGIVSDVQEGAREEALEYAEALVSQTGADYSHLLLNQSLFSALLGDVSAVPTTFFIDENGEILDTIVGAMDKASWKEKVDAFLEK